MKRKEAVYKGLEFIPVYFEDTSLTSPEYFQITEFPTRLTAGKNLFKLRGHPTNLRVGSVLGVEVLDYNGDPIYSEVVDFIDEDKSRVIAIYIYSETSPGDCTITLVGESVNVPADWTGRLNTRWSRTVPVNPNVSNISEIIFEKTPTVSVQEIIGVQLDRQYPIGQFPTFSSGSVRLFSQNNQTAIELQGAQFTSDMSTGTITIATPTNPTPTPSYPIPTTSFTSTIKKILSPTTALLDGEYTAYSSQTLSAHTFTAFDWSAYTLNYQATPQYTLTENSQSFAYIEIEGLQPATGDVSRVKLFTNNNGTVANWELVNDIELPETEIFVTSTASLLPDQAVGVITSQQHVNTYWTASAWQGSNLAAAPTLTYTTASLNAAIQITSSPLTARNQAVVVSTKTSGRFVSGSAYRVTFDALGAQGQLAVYLSGSAFNIDNKDYYNQEFGIPFGKRVGAISAQGVAQRFDDHVFSFEADSSGYGVLNIVIESGEWQIADIHVTSDNDAGYTPNYTRIKTPIQTTHKIDNQIDFRVEYYNVNGEKSRQESQVLNLDWEGGNRYIDGDYSMLTGSLYVADSLNSGVAISGYPNSGFVRSLGYEGFAAGFPGFLLWSGSAMPGSLGTKGSVPYTGVGLELYANSSSYFRYATADSEIDVRTDKFFFGNPSLSYISGSNGIISISSSNFTLSPQGDVTASNANFTGTAIADIITDRSVSITTANSSSYISYYTLPTGQNASRLYLNGALGGQKVRRVTFNCNLQFPLGKITTPGEKLEVFLTNQYDYQTIPPGYTGPYTVSIYDIFTASDPSFVPAFGYDIKQLPAGETIIVTNTDISTDAKTQTGGSVTLFDHEFQSDVITKTLKTSQSMHASMPIITASISLSTLNSSIYLVNTSIAPVTITLAATTPGILPGTLVTFKKIGGTNSLILNPAGSIPIDGALTKTTTDASASIQLLYQGNTYDYLILNAYGTWT